MREGSRGGFRSATLSSVNHTTLGSLVLSVAKSIRSLCGLELVETITPTFGRRYERDLLRSRAENPSVHLLPWERER